MKYQIIQKKLYKHKEVIEIYRLFLFFYNKKGQFF